MQLRDYQQTGAADAAELLKTYGIAYIAFEVRCGKTLTALAAADLMPRVNRVLFVTKKIAIASIEKDYEQLSPAYRLDVINFESLHKVSVKYDLYIIDEAHSLGAYPKPSLRTKQLRENINGQPVIFLSGTPSPESFSQLYHQFWICGSRSPWAEYKSFYKWCKDYVNVKELRIGTRTILSYDDAIKEKVLADIDKYRLTKTQEEAGFTELVQERIFTVPLSPIQKIMIKRIKADRVLVGNSGAVITADTPAKLMSKIHQISSGSVITDDDGAIIIDKSKAVFIRDSFKGSRYGIFYKFQAERTILEDVFGEDVLTSSPEEFQSNPGKIFCSQIQSGREGVNLSKADFIVMYNIDFSATSYFQARARMQSKDRETDALLYWIFSEGGIEQDVYEAVCNKKDFTTSHFFKTLKQ